MIQNPFKKPDPTSVAADEAHTARLELLEAHKRVESAELALAYAQAHVETLQRRIKRLNTVAP